jgi:hypothetical protein
MVVSFVIHNATNVINKNPVFSVTAKIQVSNSDKSKIGAEVYLATSITLLTSPLFGAKNLPKTQ